MAGHMRSDVHEKAEFSYVGLWPSWPLWDRGGLRSQGPPSSPSGLKRAVVPRLTSLPGPLASVPHEYCCYTNTTQLPSATKAMQSLTPHQGGREGAASEPSRANRGGGGTSLGHSSKLLGFPPFPVVLQGVH